MSGSYSSLASFPGSSAYIFAWQSRGAVSLTRDDWMGDGYTQCSPRWLNHNVAISMLKDKSTLQGAQAISTVGAASGDDQVTWITKSSTTDQQNVHVATLDSTNAIVTWEQLSNPNCQPVPLGCTGTFSGTFFQQVDSQGKKVGDAISAKDVFVAGDMQRIAGKGLCWPYVSMDWDLSAPKDKGTPVSSMSFACIGGSGSTSPAPSSSQPVVTPSKTAGTVAPSETVTPVAQPSDTTTEGPAMSTSAPGPVPTTANGLPSTMVTKTKKSKKSRSPAATPTQGESATTTQGGSATPTQGGSNNSYEYTPCDDQTPCPEGSTCYVYGGVGFCIPHA